MEHNPFGHHAHCQKLHTLPQSLCHCRTISTPTMQDHHAGNAALLRGFASGPDDNMDDDFKPQFKGEKSDSVEQAIREDVSANKVLLYMKVLPAMHC